MVTTVRAKIREEDGHQVIVLPDDIRFDGSEVIVRQDAETGDLTISALHDRSMALRALWAEIDATATPEEDWEAFDAALRESRENVVPENDEEIVRLVLGDE